MHIPSEMLNGSICPVSAALAVTGIALATRFAIKSANKPDSLRFAAVAALIFAGQMLNFPVQSGTSGHLLGGVLASAVLGVPYGVLAMALVVAIQSLVFADGGLLVLGVNVFNMALIGAGVGGLLHALLLRRGLHRNVALMLAGWASIMLAATACSVELALSGTIAASQVLPAMLGVHALIGVGEALVTLLLVGLLDSRPASSGSWKVATPFLGALLMATVLSPFASAYPDGLEWVAQQYGFLKESAPLFVAPLADYAVPALGDSVLSTALAGLAGVLLVAALGALLARMLRTAAKPSLAG
ncbi:cobalamin biosynthesis protein CbiM [Chitiniphilus shinanonensis]|uniref:Cobalamin (Vitamin B12) biosynthesis CbiM protein n=1 Tax=Chitiniphilus shinanonensis TaxID=553088 RepID=F8WSW3_9NEIS|nr:energy-coupling factor ABC transporter permease [Chitiniphilus shinanonensis]BAK53950.1 cobalamin (Vitamin B12) biosynthesis CbiM protein [Chitiniphilus shinanonensis]GLS05055.1 cobalamin biosynthesis protein CbiM [Chitiniphilus shinanonensis]